MSVLPWVVLVVLLSAETCLSQVDLTWLTEVVKTIRAMYRIKGQFCLTASIPLNEDPHKLKQILSSDSSSLQEGVKNTDTSYDTIQNGDVYKSDNIIAAKPDCKHAEFRVLSNLDKLKKTQNNFLLIYSYLSPCSKCTGHTKFNIIQFLENRVKGWSDSAFVFTTVFDKPKNQNTVIDREVLEDSLIELGKSMGGLKKVYRCYGPSNDELKCYTCAEQNRISEICIDNKAVPKESVRSSSRSGQRESKRYGSKTHRRHERNRDCSPNNRRSNRSNNQGCRKNSSRRHKMQSRVSSQGNNYQFMRSRSSSRSSSRSRSYSSSSRSYSSSSRSSRKSNRRKRQKDMDVGAKAGFSSRGGRRRSNSSG